MVVNENNLFEYIKTSTFLDDTFRNNLLKYYEKLSKEKISYLVKYFNNINKEVLVLLTKFKDIEICSFEDVKTEVNKQTRMKIKLEEEQEKEIEQEEFFNLLETIDNF